VLSFALILLRIAHLSPQSKRRGAFMDLQQSNAIIIFEYHRKAGRPLAAFVA
jgi:hypothetical protein